MFTGLIEEIGAISEIQVLGNEKRLVIRCTRILEDLTTGDSIAVNGVCLTAETVSKSGFSAFASSETLKRSTFHTARVGQQVNLERALTLSDRLGGHLVQGHVDTIGTLLRDRKEGDTLFRTITIPESFMKYVAEKGSVTVDGISLTVASKGGRDFSVSLIPETLKRTTLSGKKSGDEVNIETDILAKYTESLLNARSESLSENKLKEYGF